jgi:orotate phosphoribosyltransferase
MAWRKRRTRIRDLAEGLAKAGALQFGTFTLPDGRESSYFINLRGLPSYPGAYSLVVDAMTDLVSSKAANANAICGIPITGLLIASPVALTLKKPLTYTRSSRQSSGRVVEGEVRPGWNLVVVDDLATSGKTILASAKAVEEEGGEVKHAAVLIDRLEGARERLSKQGIALHAVTDVLEIADTALSMGLISDSDVKAITRSVGKRPSKP